MNDEMTDFPPEDAAVYALAPSPDYPADGICFAATTSGLLVSRDHCQTFADAYAALNLPERLPTPAVALSPAFWTDGAVFAGVQGAIMRSHDRGASWQYAELRTPPPVVTCLAASPTYEQEGIVFAGTLEDGVFRSADRGGRWAAWNFGLIDLDVLCLALSPAFGQDETLVVGTETGLFRSTNGGRAWRELGLPTELAPILSVALSPRYAQDGILFAGTESNGLWKSNDRGRSWELIEALGESAVNGLVVQENGGQLAIAALAGNAILLSRDSSRSWHAVPHSDDIGPVCLAAPFGLGSGGRLLVGCADGTVHQIEL